MSQNKMKADNFFKLIHMRSFNDINFKLLPVITLTLKPGQCNIVKWMINRENKNDLIKIDGSPFSGGILADKFNLDKMVEILCCIKANPAPLKFYDKNIYFENCTTDTKIILKTSSNTFDKVSINCYCVKAPPNSTLITCTTCGKNEHAQCVRFNEKYMRDIPYLCVNCLNINRKYVQCKATLIIVPQLILNEFMDKITENVIKLDLKVFVYNGVHFDGYIHPHFFNDYDVVIISISNLLRDLNINKIMYGKRNTLDNKTQLRYRSKYKHVSQSSLAFIQWWRICFAEGQFFDELHIIPIYANFLSIQTIHTWIIPFTIKEQWDFLDIDKILFLLESLKVKPYCKEKQFVRRINNQCTLIFDWCSKLIWHSSIREDESVEKYFSRLFEVQHNIIFPEIEKYLYMYYHKNYYNKFEFFIRSLNLESNQLSLSDISQPNYGYIMNILNEFEFATSHLKNELEEFINMEQITTFKNIIDLMIAKTQKNYNYTFKHLITTLEIICMYHLKKSDMANLVIQFIKHFMDQLKSFNLSMDTNKMNNEILDLIILYHKHKKILYNKDFKLKHDMKTLEKKCIQIDNNKLAKCFELFKTHTIKTTKLIKKISIGWWDEVKILNWNLSAKDFLAKVEVELDYYHMLTETNIALELNSVKDIYNVLNTWLIQLYRRRKKIISIIKTLDNMTIYDLVQSAEYCKPSKSIPNKRTFKKKLCLICQAKHQLKMYVKLLFCTSDNEKELAFDGIDVIINKKIIPDTEINVTQREILFLKLIQYAKANIPNTDYLQDISEYVNIFDVHRMEFKYLEFLLDQLNNSVTFHTLINNAKSGANIEHYKKQETNKNIDTYDNLKAAFDYYHTEMNKEIHHMSYLKQLKKEKDNSTEPFSCIICDNTISTLALFPCGHIVCCKCLMQLKNDFHFHINIVCPLCRNNTTCLSFLYATNNQENEIPNTVVKGNFSIKIKSITNLLIDLIAENSDIKTLVYSSKDSLLDLLACALKENSINYSILKSTLSESKFYQTLRNFNMNKQIHVLLLNLSCNSMDIDLTIASRVILMEPNLSSLSKQNNHYIINLINRPEQTKTIFLHRFIVQSTVDDIIPKIFPKNMTEDEINNIKLDKLFHDLNMEI